MTTAIFVVPEAVPAGDPQKGVIDAFYSGYELVYHERPSPFSGSSYDAMLIALDAVKRAGSTDKAKVRQAIEETKDLAGLNGVFTMSPSDRDQIDSGKNSILSPRLYFVVVADGAAEIKVKGLTGYGTCSLRGAR